MLIFIYIPAIQNESVTKFSNWSGAISFYYRQGSQGSENLSDLSELTVMLNFMYQHDSTMGWSDSWLNIILTMR